MFILQKTITNKGIEKRIDERMNDEHFDKAKAQQLGRAHFA